ncbi:GGDEF domain-containing protein [Vibrio sonorensis]|uniref:GGDEF domain-containing protein n=1 Tax=Vibrio sonorensis TaxID=1004316 RepID=UPI000ACCA3BF
MELDLFNPSKQLRRSALISLSSLLGCISALFAITNFLVHDFHLLAYVEGSFAVLSLFIYKRAVRGRYSRTITNIYIYHIILLVSLATLTHPLDYGIYIWGCLTPIMFYLILGKRNGLFSTVFMYVLLLSIVGVKALYLEPSPIVLPINFALCFGFIWVITHVYEVKRRTSEASLGQLASRDALTGVYNRHALIHNFESYRKESQQVPLSLLILDLDHFKQVNDQFGHDTGDKVLIQAAALLDAHSDEHLVYRIGGEEFCIALHNTTQKAAKQKAEQIRYAIEHYRFYEDETLFHSPQV